MAELYPTTGEATPDEIREHQYDNNEPPFSRPELLASEFWLIEEQEGRTLSYLAVDGKSPQITNYLSPVRYWFLEGSGRIATTKAAHEFDIPRGGAATVSFTIKRTELYCYEGRFSALAEFWVPPYRDFITFDDAPLSRKARHALRQAERRTGREKAAEYLMGKLGLGSDLRLDTLVYLSEHMNADAE